MRRILLLLPFAAAAFCQVDSGFEQGPPGAIKPGTVPQGWFVPAGAARSGFGARIVEQGCRTGARCAMLTGVAGAPAGAFGNVMQTLGASGYTGRRIRLRAAIRVAGPGTRAQMWLRLDRADNSQAFLENMGGNPATSAEWKTYDIEADVAGDASRVAFGVMLFGGGSAWVDDVSIDVLGAAGNEPPRPGQPANPGFELGEPGAVPRGWMLPQVVSQAGFVARTVEQGCRTGARCAMLTGAANPPAGIFGNLMQSIPAAPYTGRRIRLRAALRVEGAGTRAQMWLRLDRADNTMAFLENMNANPVTSSEWNTYDIAAEVADDINRIAFGVMLFGPGTAWVDDVSLEATGEVIKDKVEPPHPLTSRGLLNLTAFARLYGYVRFFHPSDQAAGTEWESFAIDGVREVEDATSNEALAPRLEKVFRAIAPTVQVWASGGSPGHLAAAPSGAPEITRYKHHGVELPTTTIPRNAYKSTRERMPAGAQPLPKAFEAELVPGVTARVPLALPTDAEGTLPHAPQPARRVSVTRSAGDRGTRLAGVVIAWNVFQHFYPYFDVVKTDWRAELDKALRSAATDTNGDDFHKTLRRLVAALKDGHGYVSSPRMGSYWQPPLTLDWIENQFTVTRVRKGTEGAAPGDRVLKIDGKPVEQAAAEARELSSGATQQWLRARVTAELSRCGATGRMKLELEPFAAPGGSRTVDFSCVPPNPKDPEAYTEPRPDKIAELEPGVFYVDLTRIDEADWTAVVPKLEKARGILFDMRGYPGRPGTLVLTHLSGGKLRSAKWNIPEPSLPDRLAFPFVESGWDLPAEEPLFTAPRAFLTDGRAISYAETVMGIVEHYKLGEIVGGPTAGTNGNVNPFRLPGGYTIVWTGMKVLKHDGSQHHGIGILPTVPAARTRKGVAEGRDEILLRGLEVVKAKAARQ